MSTILKIQRSLVSTGNPSVLAYDEARKFMVERPMQPSDAALFSKDCHKRYVVAEIVDDSTFKVVKALPVNAQVGW